MNIETKEGFSTISNHAILQYMIRFRPDLVLQIQNDIKKIISDGIVVKPKDSSVTLMNNGYKQQVFKKYGNKVAVISNDNCIVTILDSAQDKKRFK